MDMVYTMQGVSSLIEVYEDRVCITPQGMMGFLTQGLKGTKTIPYSSITAIQFKEAGGLISGYLQFSILGGIEGNRGAFEAAGDENTFMFKGHEKRQENNAQAKIIKEYIESAMRKLRTPQAATISSADEIQKLAKLRDQGILTDEEFQTGKRRLLG